MIIKVESRLSDNETLDAVTTEAYNYIKTRAPKAVGFYNLRAYLGVSQTKCESIIAVLKRDGIVHQVGFDERANGNGKKGGPIYRFNPDSLVIKQTKDYISDVCSDIKFDTVVGSIINTAIGHETWCMLTSQVNPRCTCKPKEQAIKPPTELKSDIVKVPKNVTPQAVPPAVVKLNLKRVVTESEVMHVLQTMNEATSIEIAALLDLEGREQTNRVSMICSNLFNRNLIGRSQRRNAGNGSFLYYTIPNALAQERNMAEIVLRPTTVETVTINDPYRALYMKSIYERIIAGEKLNVTDLKALALAMGVTPEGNVNDTNTVTR